MSFSGKPTYAAGTNLPELHEDVSDIIGIVTPFETPLLDHLGDPKMAANWVMTELMGLLNAEGKSIAESPVSARNLGELVGLIRQGTLSNKLAKDVFAKMFSTGEAAPVIMEREGLKQISDTGALEKVVDDVLAANPKQVEQLRGGKATVMGFLVGQVMKATRGQANPQAVNELLKRKLG